MSLHLHNVMTNVADGGSGAKNIDSNITPLPKFSGKAKYPSIKRYNDFLEASVFDNNSVIDAKNIDYVGEYSLHQLTSLDTLKKYAFDDAQINTSGLFLEFTDIQNVMFSDMSLLELIFSDNDKSVCGKTIGELYMESLGDNSFDASLYDKLQFDAYKMLEMSEQENWDKYRYQVLGKLVRYGFGDFKIVEKIDGADGFSAIVFEDVAGNKIVYFPCTNMTDFNDFLYDLYPVVGSMPITGEIASGIPNVSKRMHESQQSQAKELLDRYVNDVSGGTKVNVAGFSLGGSLAEVSFLNSYSTNSDKLGNIVLFNPYHNRLTDTEIQTLKDSGKYKLYVCEGDSVSTVFNYDEFCDLAKTIYIDYQNSASETIDNVNKDNSVLNLVINNIKNDYCDLLIEKINNEKKDDGFWNYPRNSTLDVASSLVGKLKELKLDGVGAIKTLNSFVDNISLALNKLGIKFDEKQNLEFLSSLHYIEFLFISTHLTYTVDPYKNISFDENGNVKQKVNLNGEEYGVTYPSFNDSMKNILGADPYEGLSNVLRDTKDAAAKPIEGFFGSIAETSEKLVDSVKNTGAEVSSYVTGKLDELASLLKKEDK